jgi:toxin ParE1/3/4
MGHRLTRAAEQDVVNTYIQGAAAFGIDQAERYHAGLVATFELLADNPRLAREREEFQPPVRLHPYGAHMIVYVIETGGILIVRLLHDRQDWERALA